MSSAAFAAVQMQTAAMRKGGCNSASDEGKQQALPL